ncbi:hypothetical protein BGZ74_007189 [Mortierella antarctica]|nr:hypothetical protein BGZ74_007189 [Mortierella antarctica]
MSSTNPFLDSDDPHSRPSTPSLYPPSAPLPPPSPPTSFIHPNTPQPSDPNQLLHTSFEDEPPAYEVIDKDVPQLHDNYDHLRGPPGQRGQDIKGRIPADSYTSNRYSIHDDNGAGSSSAGPSRPTQSTNPYANLSNEPIHYGSSRTPHLGLTGQIVLPTDEDEQYAREVDHLLGAGDDDTDTDSTTKDKRDRCCYVANFGQAWLAFAYLLLGILPWSVFCFGWTLAWAIAGSVSLIFPPVGYFLMIFAVTSWRALARADLALSRYLVSDEIAARYPCIYAPVYIPREPSPPWTHPTLFGRKIPLPEFMRRKLESRHRHRSRRPKNLWARSVSHLKETVNNAHTVKSMFYFMTWKLLLALPVFVVVVVLTCFTAPFMLCLLPTLLAVCQEFANWQYRWAVAWLSEKPSPIILHSTTTTTTNVTVSTITNARSG